MSEILEDKKSSDSNNCNNREPGNIPIGSKKLMSRELNDFYVNVLSQCSQEDYDKIDVVWDWYSPKSKPKIPKQEHVVQQSPKLTVKRQPSSNQLLAIIKLKEELETLNDEAVVRKSEKDQVNRSLLLDLNDAFDDSMEEQLAMCSQEVEQNINQKKTDFLDKCTSKEHEISQTRIDKSETKFADDWFDCVLETIKDEDLKSNNTQLLKADCNSFEIESDQMLEMVSSKIDSPIQCSPEEIEQKRLQALAKLQAKRKQDVIEQNRQKALKRLEITKKRRALKSQTFTFR